ncbi:MAG: glycosyltransferase family 4 protein [Ilumatobacter sp.]
MADRNGALRVAVDAGPLRGIRTGIRNSVEWSLEALENRRRTDAPDHPLVTPYVVSLRSALHAGERRIPLPAASAHRLWAQRWSPPVDRALGRPDVVHGTNYVVPPARAARLVTVHDCWFLEHPRDADPGLAPVASALRRAIERGAHVVTCSDATTARVRALFEVRSVSTVHHGPPAPVTAASSPPPGVDRPAPFVLALGTIERRKNVTALIDAFGRVASSHPTVELRLVGRDGDDAEAVGRSIDRLGDDARRRVVRHEQVDDGTKRWFLEHASVLAYPSLDEGFGFPILEAQQTGTPVVASTAGSIPEVAGDGALLSDPHDTISLADHLSATLESDTVRHELVARGRRNLERFSWERSADELVHLYHRVADDA